MRYYGKQDYRFRKIASVILALMMIVVVLFSSFIIAVKAEHECEGEQCHVCECIEVCIGILHKLGVKLSSAAAFISSSFVTCIIAVLIAGVYVKETPVTSKVRLNN